MNYKTHAFYLLSSLSLILNLYFNYILVKFELTHCEYDYIY